MKKQNEWKLGPGKCACCHKCKIYIEGPMKGTCIYLGPYNGYMDENGNPITINLQEKTD